MNEHPHETDPRENVATAADEPALVKPRSTLEEQLIEQAHQLTAQLTRAQATAAVHQESDDDALRHQIGDLRDFLAKRVGQAASLAEQIETLTEQLARWDVELEAAQKTHAALIHGPGFPVAASESRSGEHDRSESTNGSSLDAEMRDELERLRRENRQLVERLAESEAAAGASSDEDQLEQDDQRRRLELALEELRELKHANEELESKLQDVESAAADSRAGRPPDDGAMDWESQKRRMMSALDSDFDDNNEEERADRVTVEGAVRVTDEIVAEKDHEIAALRELLAQQQADPPPAVEQPSVPNEVLDQDEVIQQERKKLEQLQAEWHEKLRAAEVDLSVERAKISRERLEIEENTRNLQDITARSNSTGNDAANKPNRSARGRWLARLGLKEDET